MEENQIQIPEGWRKVALGKVLRYAQPYRFIVKSTNYDAKSGTPVLTAGKSFILGYTNEADNIYSETPIIIFDDFTTDTKFVDFPFKVKSSAMKFLKAVDEKEIDLKYAFEKIQTIKITETGGDHKRRWISEYSKIEVLFPEFTEQQSIANILSKTDQAIANTEALIAKYTQIKAGLMQDILTKGIDENGNIRTEQTHEFKDSPLGRIPKDWEVKKLDECINKNTTITYGIVQTFEHIVDGVPVLRTIDLKENGINSVENLLRTKKSISDKYRRTLLLENDIVCNVRASVGDFNIVSAEYVNCNTTRGVARICPSNDVVNKYLVWFLKSYKNEKQMELLIKGTTFIDINIGDLRKIWVLLPSKTEQELIADKLDKIQSSFHIYQTELSKLQSLKTGLMQDLLSGKVRVKINN
jgi:type I restriction enzyme S subunit